MDGKDGNKNGASVWLFGRGQDRVDGGNRIEPATRSERVRERIRAHHRKIKMLTKERRGGGKGRPAAEQMKMRRVGVGGLEPPHFG